MARCAGRWPRVAVKRGAPDDECLDTLYAAWRRLGVNFSGPASANPVEVESLIMATAEAGGIDERLTVCAASWLACYPAFVDGRRLSELARAAAPLARSYLGVLLTLALESPDGAHRAPQYRAALAHCKPATEPRAFYDVIERTPKLREFARTHTLPLYRRFGLWHDDVTLKRASIHPLARLLSVPELRARTLCGPLLEAQ